jgi:hypothetical protein
LSLGLVAVSDSCLSGIRTLREVRRQDIETRL